MSTISINNTQAVKECQAEVRAGQISDLSP
jgi:hypothetical protein